MRFFMFACDSITNAHDDDDIPGASVQPTLSFRARPDTSAAVVYLRVKRGTNAQVTRFVCI